ncbi:metallophosphoesterase [Geminicoccus roseus]|uniref:metallophosphoesterase n=1 Tax=Geminicoccus roseus TaxID=404900 RepID=UPI0004166E04|nr:metallophosphoesterase [Geminicoccus roseus]
MLGKLFRKSREREEAGPVGPSVGGRPPRLPRGIRIYAIGDVHGRLGLLRKLEGIIAADHHARGDSCQPWIVYLGDYVDRGAESRQVIQHLIDGPPEGFEAIHLLGNHDLWLREFLEDPAYGPSWYKHGGDATLLSYGVRMDPSKSEEARFKEAQLAMRGRVPHEHRRFLSGLELGFSIGDYFMVHAGIMPSKPFDQQSVEDLLWVREPFLSHDNELAKVVVHGHTVEDRPTERRHRIGIDTGACWTGMLSALGLEEDQRWYLQTGADGGS